MFAVDGQRAINLALALARDIAFTHHEKWDGSARNLKVLPTAVTSGATAHPPNPAADHSTSLPALRY